MFFQIVNALGQACQAVYGWFWNFLHDGYGNIAITVVIGMVIFSIVYRFFILPVMGMHIPSILGPVSTFGSLGSGSDSVNRDIKPHPSFSSMQPDQKAAEHYFESKAM